MSNDIDKANKEIEAILKNKKLKIAYNLNFPMYKQLPDEVQLSLKILIKHGLKIVFTLIPQK